MPRLQSRDVEGSRDPEENVEGHAEEEEEEMYTDLQSQNPEEEVVHVVDNVDDSVHLSDDARNDSAVNGQERRFGDIDFQHVPETAEPISVECEAPKI